MKIASITLYCSEDFRLENWVNLYNEYKDELYLHIIVNNGNDVDTSLLKERFSNSLVICSSSSNMTHSYNMGVLEAMKDPEVDAIMQITNDIKLPKGTITALYDRLFSDKSLAVIGPVILKKGSDIVECFGYIIPKPHCYSDAIPLYRGLPYKEIKEDFKYVSSVPGGAIMVKRKAFEEYGLQDEKIHMYCDERDMFIRFNKLGYREGVLCTALASHEHIFKPGMTRRSTMATYLTARNRVYLTAKHSNLFLTLLLYIKITSRGLINMSKSLLRHREQAINISQIKGAFHGLIGKMN